MVTGKVRHPHGLGSLQQAESPPYLWEAQEESRRCGLLSWRVLASSGQERKCWGGECRSGSPKSACTEDARGCVASSENIWVCSWSVPRPEVEVREQGKDGGWVRQRCERAKPRGTESFALRLRPPSLSPSPAWGDDISKSCALQVSFLIPGQLHSGPALR